MASFCSQEGLYELQHCPRVAASNPSPGNWAVNGLWRRIMLEKSTGAGQSPAVRGRSSSAGSTGGSEG